MEHLQFVELVYSLKPSNLYLLFDRNGTLHATGNRPHDEVHSLETVSLMHY